MTKYVLHGIIHLQRVGAAHLPKKGGISMEIEQLVLYIILAYILLEIFKTIKK